MSDRQSKHIFRICRLRAFQQAIYQGPTPKKIFSSKVAKQVEGTSNAFSTKQCYINNAVTVPQMINTLQHSLRIVPLPLESRTTNGTLSSKREINADGIYILPLNMQSTTFLPTKTMFVVFEASRLNMFQKILHHLLMI